VLIFLCLAVIQIYSEWHWPGGYWELCPSGIRFLEFVVPNPSSLVGIRGTISRVLRVSSRWIAGDDESGILGAKSLELPLELCGPFNKENQPFRKPGKVRTRFTPIPLPDSLPQGFCLGPS